MAPSHSRFKRETYSIYAGPYWLRALRKAQPYLHQLFLCTASPRFHQIRDRASHRRHGYRRILFFCNYGLQQRSFSVQPDHADQSQQCSVLRPDTEQKYEALQIYP